QHAGEQPLAVHAGPDGRVDRQLRRQHREADGAGGVTGCGPAAQGEGRLLAARAWSPSGLLTGMSSKLMSFSAIAGVSGVSAGSASVASSVCADCADTPRLLTVAWALA